jgi:penicillin-binding protein 1A
MNLAALALGGMTNGISPIEMASAYGTFPNKGVYVEPCSYTRVEDAQGNVLLEKVPYTNKVFDESVAFIMTDILQTTVTRGIAGRAAIGTQPVGGKTGTTSDNVDAWFVGFTPQFAASVWIGNDVNIELSKGSSAAAALWSKVMKRVCSGYSYGSFPSMPSNVYVLDGEYYVTGTSPTGPTASADRPEVFYDENGNPYIIDSDTGDIVYVTVDPTTGDVTRISTPSNDDSQDDQNAATQPDTNNTTTTNPGTTTPSTNTDNSSEPNNGTTTPSTPTTSTTPSVPAPPHGVVNDAT